MLSFTVTGGMIDVRICISVESSIVIVDAGAETVVAAVEILMFSTTEVATDPEAVTVRLC